MQTFVVQCSWCGSKIRDDKKEETNAVCLTCFYQILKVITCGRRSELCTVSS